MQSSELAPLPDNPIIVALDGLECEEAAAIVNALRDLVWGFKANDLALAPEGRELMARTHHETNWFLDLKLHDIPNTVAHQVCQVQEHWKANFLTVHLSGGPEMLRLAQEEAAATYNTRLRLLGVSVLTSLDDLDSQKIYGASAADVVQRFARMGHEAGLHGIVCSGKELQYLTDIPLIKVVPGIRPLWFQRQQPGGDDQARVMSPDDAIAAGADYLVIGRPILQAADRRQAALDTAREAGYHPFLVEALKVGALKFGSFTLKSQRVSPYFFNVGAFQEGPDLTTLGQWYAKTVLGSRRWHSTPNLIVGPAYKGIPIACATAQAAAMPYAFDRKEAKTHGDKGDWVGRAPREGDAVVIVDDVITDGATKREMIEKVEATGASVVGIVVALDRQERGAEGTGGAVQALERATRVPVEAIATFYDLQRLVQRSFPSARAEVAAYHQQYGVR